MRYFLFTLIFTITCITGFGQNQKVTASPNPFINSTQITLHDLENDTVDVDIYNIVGQLVDSYFNNIVLSGTVTVTFNAHSLDDGVFIVRTSINSDEEIIQIVKDSTATSVTPLSNNKEITLYPNPATDHININSNEPIETISIYNSKGALVKESSNLKHTGFLDISNLSAGIYVTKIKTKKSLYTQKLIIE
ncbi:T9SS type A sorting domain-containing protein [Salibacter sp.]|uniref:T9SS type A sorting domain-containing protein n=1 Tax=Salibacter sp. TaxID=2010995 RepID=UPI0028700BDF|nr:T9SS type A sorting domain-containing protein [Salibacter sp.]MDR9488120.1 T9SS type A sorting domain-containing protein [Salibacter sp.]